MKPIQPVILGLFGGLVFSLALLAGLYFSPLRETLYFSVDPEMAQVRAKLSGYREWINQADLSLAAKEDQSSDSLRAAQTVAWREYKKWRTYLGDLARAHAKPTAEGMWTWTYSLRYWAMPGVAVIAILPALIIVWRGRNRFSTARNQGRKAMASAGGRVGIAAAAGVEAGARRGEARAQALANFEDAVKKAAKLADQNSGGGRRYESADGSSGNEPATEPIAVVDGAVRDGADIFEPPTALIPIDAFSENAGATEPEGSGAPQAQEAHVPNAQGREPETRPLEVTREGGNETLFMQDLPPWGENRSRSGDGKSPPLAMEDEDESQVETLGVMPPTTEVERIERRKDEVLKLARKGMTSSEISRRMRISQDQVEFIIRLRREKG